MYDSFSSPSRKFAETSHCPKGTLVRARPRIAILGRFAEHTSATRYSAIVTARRVAELVWQAGGEPLTMLPVSGAAGCDWSERLNGIDGVLMPGGGDIDPARYGQEPSSPELYDIDPIQDEADLSLIQYVFEQRIPVLTICRGTQIANVARGGSMHQHVDEPHLHHLAEVTIEDAGGELGLAGQSVQASCYHHQALAELGAGVVPIAFAAEGYVEAVRYEDAGWAYGLQWHPEDNFDTDPGQLAIVRAFIAASAASAVRA